MERGNLRFAGATTKVCLNMEPAWSSIGDGWEVRPETNPKVARIIIMA